MMMFDGIPLILADGGGESMKPNMGKTTDQAGGGADGGGTEVKTLENSKKTSEGGGGGGGGGFFGPETLMILAVVIGVFMLMSMFGNKREKKQKQEREDMLSSLKKGDRVQTVGGLRGTVAQVKEDEIVLKVDESNNTKMTFSRSAISGRVGDDKAKDEKKEDKE